MRNRNVILLSTVTALLLAGCSVTPKPMSIESVREDVKNNLEQLEQISKPITKPVTLDEAIERALQNNLSKRLDLLTSVLEEQKIDIVAYEALPSLTAKAGYSQRDNYAASSSVPFIDGEPGDKTGSYSVSQDKKTTTAGIGFSWNILDFGLSYVRANQQADRFLIAKEKERKTVHNIKQEVRNAYYQAVSADELLKMLSPIMSDVKSALNDSDQIIKLKLESPMKSLTYQRELLEVIRSLNALEENLVKSKIELAKLMGLKPGTHFELSEKIQENYKLPNLYIPVQDLEKYALEHRPELQETRYQERISEEEVKAVMLKMLPGIDFNAGYSYDNNKYLLNNDWVSYGANVSLNLMNIFNSKLNRKLALSQVELAKQQKLALSIAVISQVHMALLDFEQAKKDYLLSERYFGVAKDIYRIVENENSLQMSGNLSLIKEKLNYLISKLRLSSSYAKVQNSYGKIYASLGVDEKDMIQPFQSVKQEAKTQDSNITHVVKNEPVVTQEMNTKEVLENNIATKDDKKDNLIVKNPPKEIVKNQESQGFKLKKTNDSIYSKNYYDANIAIYKGDKLSINGKKYIVREDDTISKIAKEHGVSTKEIVVNNFWLYEKKRIKFNK